MKLENEGDLRQAMKFLLTEADCFFWWCEFGYGGTAGVPDMSAYVWPKRGKQRRLVPVELKVGKTTKLNKIRLDKVQPGQVNWHNKAYANRMPAALATLIVGETEPLLMISRGVDLLSHRAGITPDGLVYPLSQLSGYDVVHAIYEQGMRQAI